MPTNHQRALSVVRPIAEFLRAAGLAGNAVALKAFDDLDKAWREAYGESVVSTT